MIRSKAGNRTADEEEPCPFHVISSFHTNKKPSYKKRRLAADFTPGPHDVICCKGKFAYNHEGNKAFRKLIKLHQQSYDAVSGSKFLKSQIVSEIVGTVRELSQHGGFVKNIDGVWYEVGDRAAKEKCGQAFRDLLHTKYSSSNRYKARVRQTRRIEEEGEELPELPTLASFFGSASPSVASDDCLHPFHNTKLTLSTQSVPEVTSSENQTKAKAEADGAVIFGSKRFFPTENVETFPPTKSTFNN
jgi:hypothetical protein